MAAYGDLNHFKPFNDIYGYWRGDEMILLAARCIARMRWSNRKKSLRRSQSWRTAARCAILG